MKGLAFFVFLNSLALSEPVQRSAVVGENGSTDLYARCGDRITLTYAFHGAAQSIGVAWFMNVGGNSTSLSAVPGFVATTSDLNATLDFNVSIPDGSSFRPLVTVTTVTNGVPSYSFFFRGSVTVKLGVIPMLESISDVVAAEGDPINIAVNVIEGKPNPIVTLSKTTHNQSQLFVALNSTHYQIRKMSASISDGGVYRVKAINAVGSDAINFTVTIYFLRLDDCDLCNANNGSRVKCIFSSNPKPIDVTFENHSLSPKEEAIGLGFGKYEVSVMIPGHSHYYAILIRNGYNLSILVECNLFVSIAPTVPPSVLATGRKTTEANENSEITVQSSSNAAKMSCRRYEGYIAAIAVLSTLFSAALIGIVILFVCLRRRNRKEDPFPTKEKGLEMHPSPVYQVASKLTRDD
ncbi:uncharacterized protein [Oscarella lobularis]|uniref:uncharacterized protein isoform X2 n=1 Tax=Oscarella lobularis TaxID=121494 RepID=UPI00331413F2